MRLWSIHPKYLDKQGLCGLWREGLLAQSCLNKGPISKCKICQSRGYLIEAIQAWDIPDAPIPKCTNCKGTGKIKTPYWNHPQLHRFHKEGNRSLQYIGSYLIEVYIEGKKRGYNFSLSKIRKLKEMQWPYIIITDHQLKYEWKYLENKLADRHSQEQFDKNCKATNYGKNIESHPLFKIISGSIESWEKIK